MTARSLLFMARHGQTAWNAAGRWQGHTDVPLDDLGRAQAEALVAKLRGEGVASIASSDLERARVTAEIVARGLGLAVSYVDPDLRERRFGIFEGLTRVECEAHHREHWARYAADPRASPPGGEPQASLVARMRSAIARARERLGAPALLVSHGGAIRALVGAVTGAPVGPVPNAGVYRFVIEGGQVVGAALLEPS